VVCRQLVAINPCRLGVDRGLLVDALTDHRHPFHRVRQCPVDRGLVHSLDPLAQLRVER
jgi:hypothetical protein